MNEEQESEAWRLFKLERHEESREALIEHHLPLVRRIAERTRFSLANRVDVEELFSSGLLGLMDAMERYTPSRKIKFSTFGSQRIRGAMIDDVRAADWVPRTARDAFSQFRSAREGLRQELMREPSDEEMMGRMNLDEEKFHKLCMEVNLTHVTSLEGLTDPERENGFDPVDLREVRQQRRSELKECLQKAISSLPEKKKAALLMYYTEDMTLKEIGAVLSVSEGRVSQILSEVMAVLKTEFHEELSVFL